MTDLTASLSNILASKYSTRHQLPQTAHIHSQLDSFLTEAYQINRSIRSLLAYLRAIRQPYLSTAPPPRRSQALHKNGAAPAAKHIPGFGEIPTHLTDKQREDIDTSTAILLRDLNGNIANLSNAAKLQHDTATKVLEKQYGKPSNFLWRWAAGDGDQTSEADLGKSEGQLKEEGEVKIKGQFRDGVIWYLNKGLKDVVGVQSEMVEVRLEREREKRMSVLYDERNKNVQVPQRQVDEDDGFSNSDFRGRDTFNPAFETNARSGALGPGELAVSELSPEQLQLFAEENNSLINYYTDTLAKVTQAEKSLMEISSLQQTLVGHLNVQGEMIGQLVDDASRTDENVRRGNKELKKASERGSVARGVFWSTVGLCSFLVVWDLIF